ncbi:hypothetical protein PP175_25210 (plasmid) [Aneurinibacillus sp. Ricciae_BoGa-3]|uniref:hypothetical protein n=1 Tax=Aneurinibacillus sp. Ricciae_BoGa-3 TaxID=3022697 RepID=UPI002341C290|nr:hypothetical protein [Aneurinibacillus sp. Ricciae_BoGa-3]WCK57368.1 hypothetical protein PP175_25210 [Aneurinibacillus sp. Ricciae_BoGa-3]
MTYIQQFTPDYLRFSIAFSQFKEIAEDIIFQLIQKNVEVSVGADEEIELLNGNQDATIRVLINIEDTKNLSDDEVQTLIANGLNFDAPYNNAETVLSKIFGSDYRVTAIETDETLLDDKYIFLDSSYEDYQRLLKG